MKLALLARRERWSLTLSGKALALLLVAGLAVVIRFEAYPFLAPNHPVAARVLIVEGWISDNFVGQVAAEFRRGQYQHVIMVQPSYGGEPELQYVADGAAVDYKSRLLVDAGVPRSDVSTLYCPAVEKDRTYHEALAVKEWFTESSTLPGSFNVVTNGPHARRSWLLFEKAFDGAAEAGIIALRDPMYDPAHWWRTSEGVREVVGEAIAYLYARFFFYE